jgi:hypothetical protein
MLVLMAAMQVAEEASGVGMGEEGDEEGYGGEE